LQIQAGGTYDAREARMNTSIACRKQTHAQFNYLRHKMAIHRAKYMTQDELLCLLLDNFDYCVLENEIDVDSTVDQIVPHKVDTRDDSLIW
jgi:5-methylcytosine-specific restriction endonuclease McrA